MGGYKAKSNVDSQKPQTAVNNFEQVTNGSEPGTVEAKYEVTRGTEDGQTYCYSVLLEADQEGYDFLTKAELDTVISGGYLWDEKRLTGE
jgi:hypothetical protein